MLSFWLIHQPVHRPHPPDQKPLPRGAEAPKGAITLGLDPAIRNREGYVLTVKADRVTLNGQTENGVFYGIQTLRKSIPAETKATSILLPAGSIQDEPRFSYRGMHLDVGRHFFPIEFIKKYIDLLALHNMNTFHWHLTEDQGWRIEIKKYPKLTEIAPGATVPSSAGIPKSMTIPDMAVSIRRNKPRKS